MHLWLHRLTAPKYAYQFCASMLPWCFTLSMLLLIYGLIGALWLAPPDYQQGEGFRIIYVHVPTAFLSLLIYGIMALAALFSLLWAIKIADYITVISAKLGALFTLIALITGALWGKPMWGTWWVWDARLTSELLLLFLYAGIIALDQALQGRGGKKTIKQIFILIGLLNVPIIHYSVYWWNTLHQGATLNFFGPSHIAPAMLTPLLVMIAALTTFALVLGLMGLKNHILWENRHSMWVRTLIQYK